MSNSPTNPDEVPRVIHPNVTLGEGCAVGPFVVLGEPPRGADPGEMPTRIGARAVIRSHTVIYAGTTIGERLQTGHGVRIREHTTIGDAVSIGTNTVIEHHVEIGDGVRTIRARSSRSSPCWRRGRGSGRGW